MLLGAMSATTPTNPANKLDETQINMLQKEGSTTEEKNLLKEPPKIADSEAQLYSSQHSLRSRTIKAFFTWWYFIPIAFFVAANFLKYVESKCSAKGEFPLNCLAIINGGNCTSYIPK